MSTFILKDNGNEVAITQRQHRRIDETEKYLLQVTLPRTYLLFELENGEATVVRFLDQTNMFS